MTEVRRTLGARLQGAAWSLAPGAMRRARMGAMHLREQLSPLIDGRMRVRWLFIATQPNSGSTALAKILLTSPHAIGLTDTVEGAWLVPQMSAPGVRWSSGYRPDYSVVRHTWLARVRESGLSTPVVIEKSPPNIVRLPALLEAFSDMETGVMRLTREPFATCASYASRQSPQSIVAEWGFDDADLDLGTEAGFHEALGRLYARRARHLVALEEISRLTLSYETLTADPEASRDAILGAFPMLERLSVDADVAVKDYASARLTDMNARQRAKLTGPQVEAIRRGLGADGAAVEALGYALEPPAAPSGGSR